MAIDTSGEWWVGDNPIDLDEYLRAYSANGYKLDEFRLSKCTCGCVAFRLDADGRSGVARRTCATCGAAHFICDSGEYWSEAEPEPWQCTECDSNRANIGVGFSLYPDDPTAVRWLYVGERCIKCGVLGCCAEWKVGLSDARYLLDQA